jgi:hypothetical protein
MSRRDGPITRSGSGIFVQRLPHHWSQLKLFAALSSPLPPGEGEGEGMKNKDFASWFPHPDLLPEGEGTHIRAWATKILEFSLKL